MGARERRIGISLADPMLDETQSETGIEFLENEDPDPQVRFRNTLNVLRMRVYGNECMQDEQKTRSWGLRRVT